MPVPAAGPRALGLATPPASLVLDPLTRPRLRGLQQLVERNRNHKRVIRQEYNALLKELGVSYTYGQISAQEYAACLSELFIFRGQFFKVNRNEIYGAARQLLEEIWQHFDSVRAAGTANQYIDGLYRNTHPDFKAKSMSLILKLESLKKGLFYDLNFSNEDEKSWGYFIHHFITHSSVDRRQINSDSKISELHILITRSLFWIKSLDDDVEVAIIQQSANPDSPALRTEAERHAIDKRFFEINLGLYALLSIEDSDEESHQLKFIKKNHALINYPDFLERKGKIDAKFRKYIVKSVLMGLSILASMGACSYLAIWAREIDEEVIAINESVNTQNVLLANLCHLFSGTWVGEGDLGNGACDAYAAAATPMRDCCNSYIECVLDYNDLLNNFINECQQYSDFNVSVSLNYDSVAKAGITFAIVFGACFILAIGFSLLRGIFVSNEVGLLLEDFFGKLQQYLNEHAGVENVQKAVNSFNPAEKEAALDETARALRSGFSGYIGASEPSVAINMSDTQAAEVTANTALLPRPPASRQSFCAVM